MKKVVPLALAALVSIAISISAAGNSALPIGQNVAAETRTISLPVTALDNRGRPVTDLRKDELRVREGKQDVEVQSIENLGSAPLTMGLVIDISRSQKDARAGTHEQNILEFLKTSLGQGGTAFVAAFNEKAYLLADVTADLQTLGAAIHQAWSSARGESAVYETIFLVCKSGPFKPEGRNVLVVLSDFLDNASHHTRDETLDAALRSHTAVFPVLLAAGLPVSPVGTLSLSGRRGAMVAKEFADLTGGVIVAGTGDDQLAELQHSLSGQYRLTIRAPDASTPGTFHKLKVESTRKGVRVMAPLGFYVPQS